jgi:hypothetical protein
MPRNFSGLGDLCYLAKYGKLYIGKVVANQAFSFANVEVFYLWGPASFTYQQFKITVMLPG